MTMHISNLRVLATLVVLHGCAGCFSPETPIVPTTMDSGTSDGQATVTASGGPGSATADSTADASGSAEAEGPGDTTTPQETEGTTTDTPSGPAQVRFIHAAPAFTVVDAYLAETGELFASNAAYGGASPYTAVPAGEYMFEIRPAGAAQDSDPLYTTEMITLAAATRSSAVAVGLVGSKDIEDSFRVLALVDAFGDAGEGIRVRILHAGADAGTVGIDIGNDGDVEIGALERFVATDAGGLELPADQPLPIGILVDGELLTQFSVPALPEDAEILVIATGLVASLPREETGFGLLAVVNAAALPIIGQDPRVYALHAFSGVAAPVVDVCFEGAVLADGLTWEEPTTSIASFQVPPGMYEVSLQADVDDCEGEDIGPGISTGALAAGEQYLATVGATQGGAPQVIVATEEFSLDLNGQAALYFIHGGQLGDFVAGVVEDDGTVADNLIKNGSNGDVIGELALEIGTYFFGLVTAQVAPFTALGAANLEVVGSERQWMVVAGDGDEVGTGDPAALRYRIVDTSEHPMPWTVTDVLLEQLKGPALQNPMPRGPVQGTRGISRLSARRRPTFAVLTVPIVVTSVRLQHG